MDVNRPLEGAQSITGPAAAELAQGGEYGPRTWMPGTDGPFVGLSPFFPQHGVEIRPDSVAFYSGAEGALFPGPPLMTPASGGFFQVPLYAQPYPSPGSTGHVTFPQADSGLSVALSDVTQRPTGSLLACPPPKTPGYYAFPRKQVEAVLAQGEGREIQCIANLVMDGKRISPVVSFEKPPFTVSKEIQLQIHRLYSSTAVSLNGFPKFLLYPFGDRTATVDEWRKFTDFLWDHDKVAYIRFDGWELWINSPVHKPQDSGCCVYVSYRRLEGRAAKHLPPQQCQSHKSRDPRLNVVGPQAPWQPAAESKLQAKDSKLPHLHPNYLQTLSQNHASWLFGGIAELIDNARDASATRLEIFVDMGRLKDQDTPIPILVFADNGCGMSHKEICRMLSFGHEHAEEEDVNRIGRFGVGFKSGAMRIGKDAIVLTQSQDSRSMGFLSTSFNEGKEVLEIPIVTWVWKAGRMQVDHRAQTEDEAKKSLKAVKEHSPFDKFNIGVEFEKISGTGTRIYVYNLERWGEAYRLQWDGKGEEENDIIENDIIITSKRPRTRPGQISQNVPLDYSLRAYVEVLFLHPRMKVHVQGVVVKTRKLGESLSRTRKRTLVVQGKELLLTMGFSSKERERANCGVFLYWHGRLIEAYKRVGRLMHSADIGRGVIGVVDTTTVWGDKDTCGVLNTKQGFEDSEAYAELEKALAKEIHAYWEEEFERLPKVDDGRGLTPDNGWAQCDKCLKWRRLPAGFDTDRLPDEWFCYLPPFRGKCQTPEEASDDVVTVKVENGPTTDSEITLDRSSPDKEIENTAQPELGEGSSRRKRLVKRSEKQASPHLKAHTPRKRQK